MRLKAGGELRQLRYFRVRSSSIVTRDESFNPGQFRNKYL
jgi:hypothetical protein